MHDITFYTSGKKHRKTFQDTGTSQSFLTWAPITQETKNSQVGLKFKSLFIAKATITRVGRKGKQPMEKEVKVCELHTGQETDTQDT